MYCNIIFYNDRVHGYVGKSYLYKTDLPLMPSDKVMCPTASGEDKRGMVMAINVPESEISDEWRDRIKAITSYDYVDVTEVL